MDSIKVGYIVMVSDDAPNDSYRGPIPTNREFKVTAIGKEYAEIKLKEALLPTYFSTHIKYLTKANTEPKYSKSDKVVIDTFWDAYTANLVKELAVQMVKANRNNYEKIGKMAVDVAKSVVENLKAKQNEK